MRNRKSSIWIMFFSSLLVMGALTTIQFYAVGEYIDYRNLEIGNILFIEIFWIAGAAAFTCLTNYQLKKHSERPMKIFAEAARKVSNGDFSVYLKPMHQLDKLDYVDIMFQDFNKMVEELGSIETLKTDFVSNVSHEMKTPISIIKNYAEILQTEHVTEEQRKEYALSIEEAAVRLSDLISNILKLNRLENQNIAPEIEEFDICRQLYDCILQFEEAWEEKGVEIETSIEDSALVRADKSLLELVWNNLISNAVKFTETGGTISVQQTTKGKYIQVSVSDTGCGMSRDSMNHIFDKFYQGDTSHAAEGNGLGLALVQRVLQLLHGDIQVISEEGRGSTFTVTLPAAVSDDHNEMENENE